MRSLRSWSSFAVIGLIFAGAGYASAQAFTATPLYLDPALPAEQRAADLVGRMTLEEKASQVVHLAAPIDRLKVPAYNWWTEALHGVVSGTATVFPEPIGLAATFNAPLIHEMATAWGREGSKWWPVKMSRTAPQSDTT